MLFDVFLFNSRYAALDATQNTSKPDSFFEAIEVRGLPDTPSEYHQHLQSCICKHFLINFFIKVYFVYIIYIYT